MTILVTGATGHVGSELAELLAARGVAVRAMTRRPEQLAAENPLSANGSPPEVVYGDAEDPPSLAEAFRGVHAAFLMSAQPSGSAERPTHMLALADAARRAGVRHVVALSVHDGGRRPDALGRWHRQAEGAVIGCGVPWTMLRPGRFMSNTLGWASMIRSGGTVRIPTLHRPATSIAPADIAEVAAVALTEGGHDGQAYQLSGPENLTPVDELRILAEVLETPLRPVEVPPADMRTALLRSGMSEAVVDAVLTRSDADDGTEILPTLRRLLGRDPITFRRWAQDNAARFGVLPAK